MTQLESDIREALAYLTRALEYVQAGRREPALEGVLEASSTLEETILREGRDD